MKQSLAALWAIRLGFGLVGLLNLVPIIGVSGAAGLTALYGIDLGHPSLLVLLRHRAVLLGLVGASLMIAAWHAPWRPLAGLAGLISMASFIGIVWAAPQASAPLWQVAWIDLLALPLLATACGLDWQHRRALARGMRMP